MSNAVSKKITDFVEDFVSGLNKLIGDQAQATLREQLKGVIGELPAARTSVAVASGKKRNYTRKQCPYPNCKNDGAPRYSQFCPEHGKMLKEKGQKAFEEAVATHQGQAMQPGGVWYKEGKKRARKIAAAAA